MRIISLDCWIIASERQTTLSLGNHTNSTNPLKIHLKTEFKNLFFTCRS